MNARTTTSYCPACAVEHPARYEEQAGGVVFRVECPRSPRVTPVSSDAALRGRLFRFETGAAAPKRWLLYFIEITGACNLACPVCYAEASPDAGRHVPVEEVLDLGRKVKADGGRWVQLTGGEPTVHPQLTEILRGLRGLGLIPSVVTNGVRLAEEPGFAEALRRAGCRKITLQFDTLVPGTSERLRGRDLVEQKTRAIRRAAAAGLRVGLVATVCDLNLPEVGALLALALRHTPALNTLILQGLTPVGRFPPDLGAVDREALLHALLRGANELGIPATADDVMPPPQYAPWRAVTHPACAALLLLCRDRGSAAAWPLGRRVDLERFYELVRGGEEGRGLGQTVLRPLGALLRSTRSGSRWDVLSRLASAVTGRGRRNLLVVSVDANLHAGIRDEERLRRCSACFVTPEGFRGLCERGCEGDLRAPGAGARP